MPGMQKKKKKSNSLLIHNLSINTENSWFLLQIINMLN